MKYRFLLLIIVLSVIAVEVVAAQPASRDSLTVSWGVRDNLYEGGGRFLSELTLTNDAAGTLSGNDWALYFNFVRMIDATSFPASLQLMRINADFYQLRPTVEFEPLAPGQSISIPFVAAHWAIKETDAPVGFYFILDDAGEPILPSVHIEPFETPAQTRRGPIDRLTAPTPASRYEDYRALTLLPIEEVGRIVPTPRTITQGDGHWTLTREVAISYEPGLEGEARFLAGALDPILDTRPEVAAGAGDAGISLRLLPGAASESYRLLVDPTAGIVIEGGDAPGVFYGIQSLRAILPTEAYRQAQAEIAVPAVDVEDAPRFAYRGMHLDVARNFQPVEAVKRLVDLMAFYKLNRFHFHLTDDEGWRLAIAPLPELTDVGGRRGHTLTENEYMYPAYGSGPWPDRLHGSGHYLREEYIGLLRFAHERHIEVIPEIDVPGHARAAIKSMEARYHRLMAAGDEEGADEFLLTDFDDTSEYLSVQRWDDNVINVCMESTYRFLEEVFDELIAMHAEAGVPLTTIHIGGDEVPRGVWEESPACHALIEAGVVDETAELWDYFIERTLSLIEERGLIMAGWEEIAVRDEVVDGQRRRSPNPAFLDRAVRPNFWNAVWGWRQEDLGYRLANAGYRVVLSNASNLYFDLAYDNDPYEPGYYWAGFLDTRSVFEFAPLHIFNTTGVDVMGNPIGPDDFADRPRLTEEGRQNVLGIQGQLWTETVRSTERMEYMAFPRLLALAERAWAAEPEWAAVEDPAVREPLLQAAWNEFANRLGQRELPRLDTIVDDLDYRLPPPGAVVEDGLLRANVGYPGLSIHYTTDGSVPTAASSRYEAPVEVSSTVKLKTFDTRGRGSRTAVVEAP